MTLTLRAVSLNELPLTQPITAQFDGRGGTIGRADHNTLALPDPERHISRQQAEIQARPQGGFLIRNIGSANPIVVAGQPLLQGESAPLQARDEVRIGGYRLEVVAGLEPDAGATLLRPAAPAMPVGAGNPFADLLGAGTTPSRAPPARAAPAAALLPDDFDPFAARADSRRAPAPAPMPAATADDPFADLLPASEGRSLDEMFGLASGTPTHDAMAGFLAGTAGTTPTHPAAPATQADHAPLLQTPFVPRPVPSPVPVPAPMPAPMAAPPPAAPAGADPLWDAFCAGAGIRPDPAQGGGVERMQLVGELLRAAIDGTLKMLAVRAATRQELRANVTMIRARDNNPLKFSPDAQSVLEQLLRPPLRGFLPAGEAMHDAMQDLVGHTIGSMAGTRAALEGVLARFEPTVLESKLSGRSVLDSVLPQNRKARLWELYLRHFEALREEAREDFHALFGKAFLEAYEEQLQRLARHAGDKQ
ncbi:type VI secretion system-associated FHA domain protein TagH [Pseudorhodoferax soli]|uniref:FHA domain protein n=1 Tax=Pseudorhodoferax soli TaxID=545864 RepID=A0A368Y8T6_9BURK|nr:type VI secretion system-associated FHA domain protein TagH [Pseudorhodoferax soli]RCW75756.1 FHA domain protein [Pseudorhodoferax soli]